MTQKLEEIAEIWPKRI